MGHKPRRLLTLLWKKMWKMSMMPETRACHITPPFEDPNLHVGWEYDWARQLVQLPKDQHFSKNLPQ